MMEFGLPSLIPLFVVGIAGLVAATTDVWRFKVYNSLTFPLLGLGIAYHALAPAGGGVAFSLLGVVFGFGILLLFYVLGGVGAGDVKLLMGCGAWLGAVGTFYVFIFSGLATGIYAVLLLVKTGGIQRTVIHFQIMATQMLSFARHLGPEERIEEAVKKDDRRKRLIPFAAMVLVGFVAAVIWMKVQDPSGTASAAPQSTASALEK